MTAFSKIKPTTLKTLLEVKWLPVKMAPCQNNFKTKQPRQS